jgi:hypothetical protein
MGTAKHENVAIFRRKMSGIRMFHRFWECEARKIDGLIVYVGQYLKQHLKKGKREENSSGL